MNPIKIIRMKIRLNPVIILLLLIQVSLRLRLNPRPKPLSKTNATKKAIKEIIKPLRSILPK